MITGTELKRFLIGTPGEWKIIAVVAVIALLAWLNWNGDRPDSTRQVAKTPALKLDVARLINPRRQIVTVTNNDAETFAWITATCAFYAGDDLVFTGHATIFNLAPGQRGSDTATADSGTPTPTRTECRIEGWRQ
jgi:hypothetical protein